MQLCLFDAGSGPRLGHVRKNHIVDIAALDPQIPQERVALNSPDARERLARVADSCPMPNLLVRRDAVRVLEEWDEFLQAW